MSVNLTDQFYVYNATRHAWLQDDEKTWGEEFFGAAIFTDPQLAEDIRERETKNDDATYVMGWMQ